MSVIQDISFGFKFLVCHVASLAKLHFDDNERVYGVRPEADLRLRLNLQSELIHIPFYIRPYMQT